MPPPPSPDEIAQQITRMADLIFVACKSDATLSLDLKIAAMGFAARSLSALDSLERGCDPKARMHALKAFFNAAFEHEMDETIADVETARTIQRMTRQPRA